MPETSPLHFHLPRSLSPSSEQLDGKDMRIGICYTRWNAEVVVGATPISQVCAASMLAATSLQQA